MSNTSNIDNDSIMNDKKRKYYLISSLKREIIVTISAPIIAFALSIIIDLYSSIFMLAYFDWFAIPSKYLLDAISSINNVKLIIFFLCVIYLLFWNILLVLRKAVKNVVTYLSSRKTSFNIDITRNKKLFNTYNKYTLLCIKLLQTILLVGFICSLYICYCELLLDPRIGYFNEWTISIKLFLKLIICLLPLLIVKYVNLVGLKDKFIPLIVRTAKWAIFLLALFCIIVVPWTQRLPTRWIVYHNIFIVVFVLFILLGNSICDKKQRSIKQYVVIISTIMFIESIVIRTAFFCLSLLQVTDVSDNTVLFLLLLLPEVIIFIRLSLHEFYLKKGFFFVNVSKRKKVNTIAFFILISIILSFILVYWIGIIRLDLNGIDYEYNEHGIQDDFDTNGLKISNFTTTVIEPIEGFETIEEISELDGTEEKNVDVILLETKDYYYTVRFHGLSWRIGNRLQLYGTLYTDSYKMTEKKDKTVTEAFCDFYLNGSNQHYLIPVVDINLLMIMLYVFLCLLAIICTLLKNYYKENR